MAGLEALKIEAAADLISAVTTNDTIKPKLPALYQKLVAASEIREVLECLVEFEKREIEITEALSDKVTLALPASTKELIIEIFAQLLSKLEIHNLRELFLEATQVNTVRALIKFLTRLHVLGLNASSLELPEATENDNTQE